MKTLTSKEENWLDNAQLYGGSFIKMFATTCWMADDENFEILQPVLAKLMEKYPKYNEM